MKALLPLLVGAWPLLGGPHAKPPPPAHGAPPPHVFVRPAPPLPMLPIVTRVRIEAARDRVVVVEELALPRGDWSAGSLDLYAAFGEPGAPLAVDAHLVAVPAGQLESRLEDAGEALSTTVATRHTPSSTLLLGKANMAGVVIHARDAQLRAVYASSDVAAVRIRTLLAPPLADSSGQRDVVVRLGVHGGLPLALGKVQIVSLESPGWITRAEATLCGPDADPHPLTVAVLPRASGTPSWIPTVAPVLATRHDTDDLCVRWWASP